MHGNHKACRMRTAKEIPDEVFTSNCDTLDDCDAIIEVAEISTLDPLSTSPGGHLWTILLLVTSAVNVGLILSYQLHTPLPSQSNHHKKTGLPVTSSAVWSSAWIFPGVCLFPRA